jgi:hypothetical protein
MDKREKIQRRRNRLPEGWVQEFIKAYERPIAQQGLI